MPVSSLIYILILSVLFLVVWLAWRRNRVEMARREAEEMEEEPWEEEPGEEER